MKIFKISQGQNKDYETFDSAVVVAPDPETAIIMDPQNGKPMTLNRWNEPYSDWCNSPEHVLVEYIGEAGPQFKQQCVICSSFNAG